MLALLARACAGLSARVFGARAVRSSVRVGGQLLIIRKRAFRHRRYSQPERMLKSRLSEAQVRSPLPHLYRDRRGSPLATSAALHRRRHGPDRRQARRSLRIRFGASRSRHSIEERGRGGRVVGHAEAHAAAYTTRRHLAVAQCDGVRPHCVGRASVDHGSGIRHICAGTRRRLGGSRRGFVCDGALRRRAVLPSGGRAARAVRARARRLGRRRRQRPRGAPQCRSCCVAHGG